MREVTTKVYMYDELSKEAKERVLEEMCNINVDCSWWEFTFDDAHQIGLKLSEFSIDRGNYCKGVWLDNPRDVAWRIIKTHGDQCETTKDAIQFLHDYDELAHNKDGENPDMDKEEELSDAFLWALLEDYKIMLQKEYDYLTSEEVIVETIKANEWEFTEDGKIWP